MTGSASELTARAAVSLIYPRGVVTREVERRLKFILG